MSYCDTCGHQFSDICGTCESLEGVPVKYSEKKKMTNNEKIEEVFGFKIDVPNNPIHPNEIVMYHGVNVAEWLKRPYQKKEKEEPLPPPLGLKPRYVHDNERLKDIISAMERYSKVLKPIPGVWIDELKDLIGGQHAR